MAALAGEGMQLNQYVQQHRARLPAELVRQWEAYYAALGAQLAAGQADAEAQRQLLARVERYDSELGRYREMMAAAASRPAGPRLAGPRPAESRPAPSGRAAASSRAGESASPPLSPLMLGGAGLALGAVLGFFVASSRDAD